MAMMAGSTSSPYDMCDPDAPRVPGGFAPKAVEAVNGQVVFRPKAMRLNRYYLAEVDGKPYVYRRISRAEVEVYGLAEAAS